MGLEWQKMLAGELYDPRDAELVRARESARRLCAELNSSREDAVEHRQQLLAALFGQPPQDAWLQPPFYCDYGVNISVGRGCFFNFNCVVLDVCRVVIGDYTKLGPGVHIYTATHPMEANLRRQQEFGKPVTIGADVWLGGGAIVCPGVTIGDGAVIGAGSVVTRDIPAGVCAAGNPCRILRPL